MSSFSPNGLFSINFGPGSIPATMMQPQQSAPMQNSQQPMPAAKPDSFSRRNMNDPASGNSNNAFFLPPSQGSSFR